MLQVADNGINPILNQYNCPAMNMRIGIDIGENAIIQSGWDIHPNMIDDVKEDSNSTITFPKKNNNLYKKALL